MKKELDIYEPYVKELWSLYESEAKDEMTFPEFLYCEYATNPTMTGSLELGGFCPDNENTEEYENMSAEEQKKEVEVRFNFFIKKAGEILNQEFAEQSFNELEEKAKKVLGWR